MYSQKLVENVELFKDMPTSAIKRIAVRLKPEILLPNDVIIQAGYEGSSMYFIIAGIVAVYTINGKEVTFQNMKEFFYHFPYILCFCETKVKNGLEVNKPTTFTCI